LAVALFIWFYTDKIDHPLTVIGSALIQSRFLYAYLKALKQRLSTGFRLLAIRYYLFKETLARLFPDD